MTYDDGLFLDATNLARETSWLNSASLDYSAFGVVLFGLLIVAAWWQARSAGVVAVSRVAAVPAAAVAAFLADLSVKLVVEEARPCYAFPHAFILETCPVSTDYSFPSNHTAVAVAMAASLLMVNRRLGILSVLLAVVMGVSRVYNGAHYPHDVLAAAAIGIVAAWVAMRWVPGLVAPIIERVREMTPTRR